ncbi:MAG TPA: hypothetical protein VMF66_01070 [Candidatus Acidoferrum sp.]|nr:hypothetical protein [Candidatus Acidoferrum sp.]
MRRLALLAAMLVVCLVAVGPAWVQSSDPLDVSYRPSIDCTPGDYPSNVSLTNKLAKLRQTADSPTSITDYGSTPLPCVTVYATQNQFADFQAHVHAPSGGYAGITFAMSALTKSTGPGGSYTIPAPSTSNNDIVVYREAYYNITAVDQTGRTWFGATGEYPDPLVPAIDPYYHQTTAAFPVAVSAGNNQSAWIDVYIPQAAPSGWYSGTVTISDSSAGTIANLPVLVAVAQWPAADGGFMPSTPTMHTLEFTGYRDMCAAGMGYATTGSCPGYPGGLNGAVDDLMVELLDNRMTLSSNNQFVGNSSLGTLTTAEKDMLNGTTISGGINTIIPGAKMGPAGYVGIGSVPSGDASNLQTWMTSFVSNGWGAANTFNYLADEPGSSGSGWNVTAGTNTRGYSTPNLPLLVTGNVSEMTSCSATNSVDWLVTNIIDMEPGGVGGSTTNQRSTYNSWLAGNCCSGTGPTRETWDYASCDPNCGVAGSSAGSYPNYALDNVPVANEALEWMTFKNQQYGELYYSTTVCWGEGVNGCSNPWTSIKSDSVYGDGTLMYPGTNSTNCSGCGGAFVNVSTPIFMPSIRLKLIRDGVQDYEYLNLLTNLGGTHATVATNAINEWIASAYCFNVVATAASTSTDTAHKCPVSGTQTFTGDLNDAYTSLVKDMQTVTYPSGGGLQPVLPPGNLSISVAKNVAASGNSRGVKK